MDNIEIIATQNPDYTQEHQNITNSQVASSLYGEVSMTEQAQNNIFLDFKSLSMPDYLIGLALILVLVAIINELLQLVKYRSKSQRLSNVELLEKIWKMEAAKIKE